MYATTFIFPSRHIAASLVIAAGLAMSGCASAGNDDPRNTADAGTPEAGDATAVSSASGPDAGSSHFDQLPADSQFQRFIIKYRSDTAPGRDPERARERLAAMQAASGVQLEWLRRLGMDADVFKADSPLDRSAAAALMDRFSADPEVEYIEVDSVLTIRSDVDVPAVKPLK